MSFSPRQLPIVLAPLPGEALDGWIEAYARRLLCTSAEFLDCVGLPRARAGQMLVDLLAAERDALTHATGADHGTLTAMTLRPFHGLAVTIRPTTRGLARPPAWRRTAGSRYCPACLQTVGGRWPLAWRLPWSFACQEHGLLLLDTCPSCRARPLPSGRRQLGMTRAGTCTTPVAPDGGRRRRRRACGHALTDSTAVPLPDDGPIMGAQRLVERLLREGVSTPTQATRSLKELFILAWRALAALQTQLASAPWIVHHVLDQAGARMPRPLMPFDAEDAHAVAVGTALAVIAHSDDHPDRELVLNWIVRADRTKRDTANIGGLLQPWRPVGPQLMGRVLAAMDDQMLPGVRLRYASTTPSPRLPTLVEAQIRQRAAAVPATLWPSWSMRLLDADASVATKPDGFRAALAAMLLLPGTKITYEHAVKLLGHADRSAIKFIKTIVGTFDEAHLKPLLSGLAQLAAALDTHGSPIDYACRRRSFTTAATVIDRDAYQRLCARLGWPRPSQHRLRLLDRYLLALLTGTHLPATPGDPNLTRGRASASWNTLRYRMPAELREFLHAQPIANLHGRRIDEPLQWEPPPHWVTGVTWRGVDPDQVDQQRYACHAAQGTHLMQMTQAMRMSTEHVRLYAEITGITAPDQQERRRPFRTAHQGVLAPDQLRHLYEQQRLSIHRITKLAGCSRQVVRDALEMAGITIREAHRQRSLPITREWLEEEYVNKQRTLVDIAHELGTSRPRLTSYTKQWNIPLWPRGHTPDPLGPVRAQLHPSPDIEAAFAGQDAVERIRRIVHLPGRRSLRAAATAMGLCYATFHHQLPIVEQALGFTIIERSLPLRLTPKGEVFIAEARAVLRVLSDAAPSGK
jgi:TniQ